MGINKETVIQERYSATCDCCGAKFEAEDMDGYACDWWAKEEDLKDWVDNSAGWYTRLGKLFCDDCWKEWNLKPFRADLEHCAKVLEEIKGEIDIAGMSDEEIPELTRISAQIQTTAYKIYDTAAHERESRKREEADNGDGTQGSD